MKTRPKCAIKGCNNPAFVLFGNHWVCGECAAAYDKKMKEKQFNQLQEALGK